MSDGLPYSSAVRYWLDAIDVAKTDAKDYIDRCDRIRRRYRYAGAGKTKRRKFQLFWANQEILKPAVYARRPSPSVTNRWKDGDAVARITCELIERNLDFQFDICDFDHVFRQVRDDFLQFARGVCRLRYDATFKAEDADTGEDGDDAGKPAAGDTGIDAPDDGDGDDEGEEADGGDPGIIDFENVHLDFVQLSDLIHPKCRTWKELPWLAFVSYMDRKALKKRFKAKGDAVKLDTVEGEENAQETPGRQKSDARVTKAIVYEIWDKEDRKVRWISPGHADVLDESDPYLKFEGFWPCPRPAYGTLATDSLEPVPDVVYYQDQLEEIDDLTARIASLSDSLKLVGFYPAGPSGEGAPEIARAVQPGFENKMIAVQSWAVFTEGGRNAAPIVWLPVDQVGELLKGCVELRKQLIDDVFQLTGISDIIRGDTEAEETAAAQGLKSQWASVRLAERQRELARLAVDVTRMAAEIVANHFQISTLVKCANLKVPTEAEQQEKIHQYQQQMQQWQQIAIFHQQQQPSAGSPPPPPQQGAPSQLPGGAPGHPIAQPHPQPAGTAAAPAPAQQMGPQQGGAPGGPPGASPALPPQPQAPKIEPTQEQIEALLRDGVTRRFLIDIETNSTIQADEAAEKQARTAVLEGIGKFVIAWLPIIQAEPMLVGLACQMLLFAIRAFPAARELEEAIEEAMDKLQAAAGQPKPPSGEQLKAQADMERAQAEIQKAQIDAQAAMQKAKADIENTQLKGQVAVQTAQMKMKQLTMEHQLATQRMQTEHQVEMQKMGMQQAVAREQIGMQHQLEAAKASHQQKTLAQQVQIDEQKLVAAQAMEQFKHNSKTEIVELQHKNDKDDARIEK